MLFHPSHINHLVNHLEPLEWVAGRRRLADLEPLEKNPFGQITEGKKRRLDEKLRRLGVFESAALDHDGRTLLVFNKRYHALLLRHGGEFEINVLTPSRALTEAERKEIILASNIHEGDWVKEILAEYDEVMEQAGLDFDLGIEEELAAATKAEAEQPEYPIVAQFSEKHDAFVIVSSNEIDTNHLKELLQLGKEASYKSTAVGQTHVLTAKAFLERWNSKS